METPTAEIISIDGHDALLRVDGPLGCARCAAGKGCGAGLLTTGKSKRELRLPLPAGSNFKPGDRVQLSFLPARLLRATLYAYGLPLLALTLVPLFADWFWGPFDDAYLATLAIAAVGLAVLLGRRLLARNRCLEQLVPGISGRVPASSH